MLQVEEVVNSLTDTISVQSLAAVTDSLQTWTSSPLTPPLPLLISLRKVITLVKRTLAAEPPGVVLGARGLEPPPLPTRRGKRRAVPEPEEEGNHDEPSIYNESVDFVNAFSKAVGLRLFHDTATMDIIVSSLCQLMTIECNLIGHTQPKTGNPTPLVTACLGALRTMLYFPLPLPAASEQGASSSDQGASESDGWGTSAAPTDFHALILPKLVPLLTASFANIVNHCAVNLRACVLECLTTYFSAHVAAHESLYKLLLQICVGATCKVRTEVRRLACEAFVQLFSCFSASQKATAERTVGFLRLLSRSNEDRQRLFAVEVAAALLGRAYDPELGSATPSLAIGPDVVALLLESLLLRSNDTYAGARRLAITGLASLMDRMGSQPALQAAFADFLRSPAVVALPAGQGDPKKEADVEIKTQRDLLLATVTCRLKEDKAWVRRSTIQLMELIVQADDIPVDVDHVFTRIIEMSQIHAEESVLVRRQALTCLIATCHRQLQKYCGVPSPPTSTLANDMDLPARIITSALLQSCARDNDESIKALATSAIAELLFVPLENPGDTRLPCVWEILDRLTHEALLLLNRVTHTIVKQQRVRPAVIKTLQAEIRKGAACAGAFELLASLASGLGKDLDPTLVEKCYEDQKPCLQSGSADGVRVFSNVLKLLAQVSLPADKAQGIVTELLESLAKAQPYHTIIPCVLRVILALGKKKAVKDSLQELLTASQRVLHDFCKGRTVAGADPTQVLAIATRYILLIGDLAMLRESDEASSGGRKPMLKVPQQVETYLQAILQTPALEDAAGSPASPLSFFTPSVRPGQRQQGPQEAQIVEPDLSQFSLLSLSQLSHASNQSATVQQCALQGALPAQLLAAALLTFGKLCLMNEGLAKRYITVFVNLLRKASHEAVKANLLAILSDLCVEYSGSVDKYVPVMSWFMGDRSVLVRHTAVVLVTQLLAEGFIKWKSFLFFSFLVAVADDNKIVATFAESALVKVLLPKHPNLFFNHFLETLFVLNGYQGHPVYNNPSTPLHDSIYALSGEAGTRKRLQIYRLMLRNLSQVQLYKLHQKLHTELLALCTEEGAPDGEFGAGAHLSAASVSINALSPPGALIMTDAFAVLLSREMRLSSRAPLPEEEEEGGAEALNELNRRVYAEMFHKHIELSVIPVLVDLKRWLQKHKSPYMKQLEEYLHMIMHEYRDQIQNMLAADPQLAVELQYDFARRQNGAMRPPLPLNRRSSVGSSGTSHVAPPATPASRSRPAATPRRQTYPPPSPLTPLSASAPPAVKRRTSGVPAQADPSRTLFPAANAETDEGDEAEPQKKRRTI